MGPVTNIVPQSLPLPFCEPTKKDMQESSSGPKSCARTPISSTQRKLFLSHRVAWGIGVSHPSQLNVNGGLVLREETLMDSSNVFDQSRLFTDKSRVNRITMYTPLARLFFTVDSFGIEHQRHSALTQRCLDK